MKKHFFFFLAIILLSCNQSDTSKSKNYEMDKKSIVEKEQNNPKEFLSISVINKRNIVGQTVVKGTIKNNAVIAKYKDIYIKLYFYSKTKALVDTEEETIYEQLFPGDHKQFKAKYFAPKGTDSVFVEILNARKGD
ncbi:MAG: hypothetical protein ABI266_06020 [Ginsengibacter sp.]